MEGEVCFSSAGVGADNSAALLSCFAVLRARYRASIFCLRSASSCRDSRRFRRREAASLDLNSMWWRAWGSWRGSFELGFLG